MLKKVVITVVTLMVMAVVIYVGGTIVYSNFFENKEVKQTIVVGVEGYGVIAEEEIITEMRPGMSKEYYEELGYNSQSNIYFGE